MRAAGGCEDFTDERMLFNASKGQSTVVNWVGSYILLLCVHAKNAELMKNRVWLPLPDAVAA
jgi:formate/nitrite transporter FocA (FNT family)